MQPRVLTAQLKFVMQNATGPNPKDLAYEVISPNGDRVAYVSSVDEAADEILDHIIADHVILEVSDAEII